MRFPLRDVITPRTTPVVTWGLSGFTLLLHLVAIFALDDAGSLVPRVLLAASNVCVLVIFGENVEDQTGHRRFLLFYAACGAAAALAHARLNPPAGVPVAALSGAAAGVMGGYLVMFFHSRVLVRVPLAVLELPAALFFGFWCVFQLLASTTVSASAFAAHATGLLSGAALIRLLRQPARARWEWREY